MPRIQLLFITIALFVRTELFKGFLQIELTQQLYSKVALFGTTKHHGDTVIKLQLPTLFNMGISMGTAPFFSPF